MTKTNNYHLLNKLYIKAFNFINSLGYEQDKAVSSELFFALEEGMPFDSSMVSPEDNKNYMIWFLCDYVLEKENVVPLHYYYNTKKDELTEEEGELAHQLAHSNPALYDVISLDPDEGILTLRNIFDMSAVELQDFTLASLAEEGNFFALRLIPFQESIFTAGDIYVYPDKLKEHLLMFLQKNIVTNNRSIVPLSPEQLIKKHSYLFNHMQLLVREVEERKEQHKASEENDSYTSIKEKPQKNDKPAEKKIKEAEVSVARAHFMVNDFEKAKEGLQSIKGFSLKESGEKLCKFSWSRNPLKESSNTEDGSANLSGRKLVFETIYLGSLEDVKSSISKNLKPYVEYMYDDVEKRRVL